MEKLFKLWHILTKITAFKYNNMVAYSQQYLIMKICIEYQQVHIAFKTLQCSLQEIGFCAFSLQTKHMTQICDLHLTNCNHFISVCQQGQKNVSVGTYLNLVIFANAFKLQFVFKHSIFYIMHLRAHGNSIINLWYIYIKKPLGLCKTIHSINPNMVYVFLRCKCLSFYLLLQMN